MIWPNDAKLSKLLHQMPENARLEFFLDLINLYTYITYNYIVKMV